MSARIICYTFQKGTYYPTITSCFSNLASWCIYSENRIDCNSDKERANDEKDTEETMQMSF